jgi:3'-phosphoadenosine 5'-phosphosulfate sulfotransferase (PAPS reductase)/FAD synthetase
MENRQEILDRLKGRTVIASISGGKDSTALSLYLTELGIDHERVHLLTGWDSEVTVEYLRGPLTKALGPIQEIRGPLLMRDLILKKGMFPSRVRRFCTEELKILPMQKFLRARDDDHVNAVGIRREESAARSQATEWEWSDLYDCEVWRPLVNWTQQDVIDIHRRHNLAPNPLYLQGAERVGCWPCINSRKSEIRMIAVQDPSRIQEIEELESTISEVGIQRWQRDRDAWLAAPPAEPEKDTPAWTRWEHKRKRLIENEFKPMSFFHRSTGEEDGWSPIRDVVQWSMTSRGGGQFELFAGSPRDDGCVRWGLCEQPRRNSAQGGNDD